MQIACEVRRSMSTRPERVRLADFRLDFAERKPVSPQRRAAASKSVWLAAAGVKLPQGDGDE